MIYLIEPLSGTMTASTAAAGAPASNLLTAQPREVWQSTAGTSHNVTLDFGADKSVDVIALLFTNAAVGATYTVDFLNSSNGVVATSGAITLSGSGLDRWPRRHMYWRRTAGAVTARKARVSVTLPASAAVAAGRMVAGKAVQLSARYGASRTPGPVRRAVETDDGSVIVRSVEPRPSVALEAMFTGATARADADAALWHVAGLSREVLLAYDATAQTLQSRLFYGYPDVASIVDDSLSYAVARLSIEALV